LKEIKEEIKEETKEDQSLLKISRICDQIIIIRLYNCDRLLERYYWI